MTRIAWVLNLDADLELRDPRGYRLDLGRGQGREPEGLVGPGDRVILGGDRLPPGEWVGRAWCPTPRALDALRAAGATPAPAPAPEVLRRVNARGFLRGLGPELPGTCWIEDAASASRLADAAVSGEWVLKREHGFAGQGLRRITRPLIELHARRWLEARLEAGEVVVAEPWVERVLDVGLHGWIGPGGDPVLGKPTVQEVDSRGRWVRSRRASEGEIRPGEVRSLRGAAERVGAVLRTASYLGPFGVDAFRWRDAAGREAFHPLCEVNARYSMAWAVGMGDRRPDRVSQQPVA